jgi:hypothetical protein
VSAERAELSRTLFFDRRATPTREEPRIANQTPPDAAGDPTNDRRGERACKVDEQRDRLGATLRSLLLVSDIGLLDGSGLDIMRHGHDHLGLKGIAYSGYTTKQDVRASQAAGFAHHLAKPSGLYVLVNPVRQTAP